MDRPENKVARIPYLDGLRAYSILVVLFGHTIRPDSSLQQQWYLQPLLSNSLLGVRIFFVLSGFLITTLLLNEQDATGRISIRGFYERRIARIFPAFYLYIAVIAAITAFHGMDVPPSSFYAASTFTWNLHFLWRHGGEADNSGVLGHFWTLSIEEQFYLFWPGILVFWGRRRALILAVAGVIFFPIFRIFAFQYFSVHHVPTGYRVAALLHTGQDMILWGVLGAFMVNRGLLHRLRTYRFRWTFPWISSLCLFVLGPVIEAYPNSGLDTSLLPTLQCLATLLLLFWLLSGEGGLLRRGLESWPAVQLGLLSYSLYIWQQPFTQWKGLAWLAFPANIFLPLAVSIVSYQLVEVPMRRSIRGWFSQPSPGH